MRRIHQRPFIGPQASVLRRFVFARDVVVEATKQRLVEMRAEKERVDSILLESIAKHGLDPEKALKRLDRMPPFNNSLPELQALIEQRNLSTSLEAIVDEYDTFVELATDPRCLAVGFGGIAMLTSGQKTSDTIDLGGDEAKFLLNPFDAKTFAEGLKGPEDYNIMPMGVGTALGGYGAAAVPRTPSLAEALNDDAYTVGG